MKGGIAGNKFMGCTSIICTCGKFPNTLDFSPSGKNLEGPTKFLLIGWFIDYFVPEKHAGNACLVKSATEQSLIGVFIGGDQKDRTSLWYRANSESSTLYWANAFIASSRVIKICLTGQQERERCCVYRLIPAEKPWDNLTKVLLQDANFKVYL